jgi:predicted O-methyltransferase YrrM
LHCSSLRGEEITDMNPILRSMFDTHTVRAPNGEILPHAAGISEPEGELLAQEIRKLRPRVSLEVGLAYGTSALFICDALAEVGALKHYIIDPNQSTEWRSIGIENLRRAGHGKLVELREEMSHVVLPELLHDGLRLDFVFHDGWHVFDQTLSDFVYIDKMLRVGGLLAFDDTTWPSMRKVLRYIVTNRNYSVVDCAGSPVSRKDQLLRTLGPIARPLANLLKPEIVAPDGLLELRPGSRCVVLRKNGEDEREITSHHTF